MRVVVAGGAGFVGSQRCRALLARELTAITGAAGAIEFLPSDDEPGRLCPDIPAMRDRHGWEPRDSLHDGPRDTVARARGDAIRIEGSPAEARP